MSPALPDPSITPPGPAVFEPALLRGAVLALLALLSAGGLAISEQLGFAIAGAVVAVVALVQAVWTRRAVYSPVAAAALLHTPPPMEYLDHSHGPADEPAAAGPTFDQLLEQLPVETD